MIFECGIPVVAGDSRIGCFSSPKVGSFDVVDCSSPLGSMAPLSFSNEPLRCGCELFGRRF